MENRDYSSRNLVRLIAGALLVCLPFGCLILAVREAEADRRARTFTLPDGDGGQLVGTGIEGAGFSTDDPLKRFGRRFLPARFQRWVPPAFDFGANKICNSNTLTVYMRFYPRSALRGWPVGGFDTLGYRWGSYQAEDASGFRYPRYPADMVVKHSSSGAEIFSFAVRGYPRQQREFLLRWWDDDGKLLATFSVPNPIRGPFPTWRPSALPQTKTNGPVTLTLESLRGNEKEASRYLRPAFRMNSKNPGWANGEVSLVSLSDASGNEVSGGSQAQPGGFSGTPFAAANEVQFLSSREPAWKISARVDRKHPQDFADDEKMVFTNLALPAPGSFMTIDRSGDCAGVALKTLVLTGGGTLSRTEDGTRSMSPPDASLKGRGAEAFWSASGTLPQVWTWSSAAPFLLLETRKLQPGDEVQVYASDENGREAKVVMNTYGNNGCEPTFDPPAGAKFLTITIAINRPLSFEFTVNPTEVEIAQK